MNTFGLGNLNALLFDVRIESIADAIKLKQSSNASSISSKAKVLLSFKINLPSISLVTLLRIIQNDDRESEEIFKCVDVLGEHSQLLFDGGKQMESIVKKEVKDTENQERLRNVLPQKNEKRIQLRTVTKSIEVVFLIKKSKQYNEDSEDSSQDDAVLLEDEEEEEEEEEKEDIKPLTFADQTRLKNQFIEIFQRIQFIGLSLNSCPLPSATLPLLNIQFYLQKNNKLEQAAQVEVLLGHSLISQRKFTQAHEIFSRAKQFYLNLANSLSVSDLNQNKQLSNLNANREYILRKAAKLELFVADSIRQPHLLKQKVNAYFKATELFYGELILSSQSHNQDSYTQLLQLTSYLCPFVNKMLEDKSEPIKMVSLRAIEFLLDNLGCTLGNELPKILKQLVLTYPQSPFDVLEEEEENKKERESSSKNQVGLNREENISPKDQKKQEHEDSLELKNSLKKSDDQGVIVFSQSSGGYQVGMCEMYDQIFEDLVNLVSSASSQILRILFNDIITLYLFNPQIQTQVKEFLIQIGVKIIGICQGDLQISPEFILNMRQSLKSTESNSDHQLRPHLIKLWEKLEQKLLCSLELDLGNEMVRLIHNQLEEELKIITYQLSNQQNKLESTSNLKFWLHFATVVLQREKRTQDNLPNGFYQYSRIIDKVSNNLQVQKLVPLFLEILEIFTQKLPNFDIFKSVWSLVVLSLNSVSVHQQQMKGDYMSLSIVASELIYQIQGQMIEFPPSTEQLRALIIMVTSIPQSEIDQNLEKVFVNLLEVLLKRIPHSVEDDTFILFDELINRINTLDTQLLSFILEAMLDKFTMKSKSQKKSLNILAIRIMNMKDSLVHFESIIELCLLNNHQPASNDNNQQNVIRDSHDIQESNQSYSKLDMFINQKEEEQKGDLFYGKLKFFEECLENTKPIHFFLIFSSKNEMNKPVQEQQFFKAIERMTLSSDSNIRLKIYFIIKKMYSRFTALSKSQMENLEDLLNQKDDELAAPNTSSSQESQIFYENSDTFGVSKLCMTRFLIQYLLTSLENCQDPKQQFNSLVLMDNLFQGIFSSPDFDSELKFWREGLKSQQQQQFKPIIDILQIDNPHISFLYQNSDYLHMRLNTILKFLPILQNLLNSPWSNIRSLIHSVICYWVRTDLNHYEPNIQNKFMKIISSIIIELLQSKESECRTGGLNILGSLCGLSYDFDNRKDEVKGFLSFFRKHSDKINQKTWQTVYDIQSDWDVTNQAASIILMQICASQECLLKLYKKKQQEIGVSLQNNEKDSKELIWLEKSSEKEIRDMISMFRGEQKQSLILWIERDSYNTENRVEGTIITEPVTYTMNEEEDAGIYYYQDDFSGNEIMPRIKGNFLSGEEKADWGGRSGHQQDIHYDLDENKLGIMELDEDDEFMDIYDKTYQEYLQNKGKVGGRPGTSTLTSQFEINNKEPSQKISPSSLPNTKSNTPSLTRSNLPQLQQLSPQILKQKGLIDTSNLSGKQPASQIESQLKQINQSSIGKEKQNEQNVNQGSIAPLTDLIGRYNKKEQEEKELLNTRMNLNQQKRNEDLNKIISKNSEQVSQKPTNYDPTIQVNNKRQINQATGILSGENQINTKNEDITLSFSDTSSLFHPTEKTLTKEDDAAIFQQIDGQNHKLRPQEANNENLWLQPHNTPRYQQEAQSISSASNASRQSNTVGTAVETATFGTAGNSRRGSSKNQELKRQQQSDSLDEQEESKFSEKYYGIKDINDNINQGIHDNQNQFNSLYNTFMNNNDIRDANQLRITSNMNKENKPIIQTSTLGTPSIFNKDGKQVNIINTPTTQKKKKSPNSKEHKITDNELLNHLLKQDAKLTAKKHSPPKETKKHSPNRQVQHFLLLPPQQDIPISGKNKFNSSSVATTKVDFFPRNLSITPGSSHSPYRSISAAPRSSSTKSQSKSKIRPKSSNSRKISQPLDYISFQQPQRGRTSITPCGQYKNSRTPSRSPPGSSEKRDSSSKQKNLRLQGSGSGGKQHSYENKHFSSSQNFNNTITSVLNGFCGSSCSSSQNGAKPPQQAFQDTQIVNPPVHLNFLPFDKFSQTDFLSRMQIDSTKSNISCPSSSNRNAPRSCKSSSNYCLTPQNIQKEKKDQKIQIQEPKIKYVSSQQKEKKPKEFGEQNKKVVDFSFTQSRGSHEHSISDKQQNQLSSSFEENWIEKKVLNNNFIEGDNTFDQGAAFSLQNSLLDQNQRKQLILEGETNLPQGGRRGSEGNYPNQISPSPSDKRQIKGQADTQTVQLKKEKQQLELLELLLKMGRERSHSSKDNKRGKRSNSSSSKRPKEIINNITTKYEPYLQQNSKQPRKISPVSKENFNSQNNSFLSTQLKQQKGNNNMISNNPTLKSKNSTSQGRQNSSLNKKKIIESNQTSSDFSSQQQNLQFHGISSVSYQQAQTSTSVHNISHNNSLSSSNKPPLVKRNKDKNSILNKALNQMHTNHLLQQSQQQQQPPNQNKRNAQFEPSGSFDEGISELL